MPVQGNPANASNIVPLADVTPGENQMGKRVDAAIQTLADNDALLFRAASLMVATDAALADGDTAVTPTVAAFAGNARVRVQTPVAAAVGESAVYKVKAAGVVPDQAGVTIDENTPINTWVAGPYDAPVAEGDTILANLVYIAGGVPTPLAGVLIQVDIVPVG